LQPDDSSGLTNIKRKTKHFNLKASFKYGKKKQKKKIKTQHLNLKIKKN